MLSGKDPYHRISVLCNSQFRGTKVATGHVVERLLDRGERLSKTVQIWLTTKAKTTETVVFMSVTGVVISAAIILAAVYFRKPRTVTPHRNHRLRT